MSKRAQKVYAKCALDGVTLSSKKGQSQRVPACVAKACAACPAFARGGKQVVGGRCKQISSGP